ncbi:putative ankyrin repeat domain-containing protein 28 [Rosellinia necatrix]|uniref:Putative ankyrin repeat domain-containing protein 28 n=1 Tax=Rosellinia necatrix TaxID=77044 RepID=A0A1W2TK77_ROSNE|nr:putative ankyrin repeat domain-containing protein 28 [Rosellinia necatrix]
MDDSWWDDFSNNLATDLAPLIALFGEAPTKQYLSECVTIEDIIIFAFAPLGVITAIVSAIRVRGTPSLRAFVGRAQEAAGLAEAELCSSTSRDVCELYTNGGIARVFGRPKLLEIVHDPQAPLEEFFLTGDKKATAGIYSFEEYVEAGRGQTEWKLQQRVQSYEQDYEQDYEQGHDGQTLPHFAPNPNLSLNIGIKRHARGWFIAAAAFGFITQSFVLVWAVLTRYHYQWIRNSREDAYAVPLTAIGTVLLGLGMGLCAHLIESKTKEQIYERREHKVGEARSTMYWIQPGNQIIGDQVFDSFGHSDAKSALQRYTTSWKDEREDFNMIWIWAAVMITSVGFVIQFLGLRACHSSVAVVQFGITIIMSVIRSGLRARRLGNEGSFMWGSPDLFLGHELDCLALRIGRHRVSSPAEAAGSPSAVQLRRTWNIFSFIQGTDTITEAQSSATIQQDWAGQAGMLPLPMSDGPLLLFGFSEVSWPPYPHGIGIDGKIAPRLNPAVEAVLYRIRLARMTGVGAPESGLSSHWGGRFVAVRDTALALAHAIEDTMQILSSSDSSQPVKLRDEWESACHIFWRVGCSVLDPLAQDRQDDSIYMSLQRDLDWRKEPVGPWKCDRSELEAVLGLWLWSLKSDQGGAGPETAAEDIFRIVSTTCVDADVEPHDLFRGLDYIFSWHPDLYRTTRPRKIRVWGENNSCMTAQNAVWRDDGDCLASVPGGPGTRRNARIFGWYNMRVGRVGRADSGERWVPLAKSNCSLMQNCAQEIYVMFLTAILQAVEDIGDHAVDRIRNALVTRGLCDEDDSFTCVISVLYNAGLLPTPNDDEDSD